MATSVQEQAVLRLVESDLGERPLRIRMIAPGIGAEIEGLRLDGDVDDETIAAVRRTVLARRVVFFRGQNLDSDGHIAFARRFGTLTRAHPTIPAVDGVPTLYDLLLPKRGPKDPANGEYRPDKFQVGSREFDPDKVGLTSTGYSGFTFDTSHRGNSNAGHAYGTGLDKENRLDLLEYLKSL